jgi:hypothetical protein
MGALAAGAAVLFALAACSAAAGGAAAPTASAGGGAVVSDEEFSAARDAYDLKLAQCMRDKGLDVKDPQPGQGIQESGEEINAAASTCMQEIGDPPVYQSPLSDTEMLDMQLTWAACFRDHGLEVDEPKLGQVFVIPEGATDDDIAECTDPSL